MKKIKIITDSTAYITKKEAEEKNIGIVSLSYIVNGVEEKEGFPGEFDEFFKRMASEELEVMTSQPAVGDFLEAYEKAFQEGYEEIIVIVLSSKLSGAYNSADLARQSLGDKMITIIDSMNSAGCMKFLVEDAFNMAKEGKTSKEIETEINKTKEKEKIYLTVDSLDYLQKGGRLSKLGSVVGNLLRIKPIIGITDGELDLSEKVRGKKQVLTKMVDLIPEDAQKVAICHILAIEEANSIKEKILNKYPNIEVFIEELGPTVGCHLGPNSLGICIY